MSWLLHSARGADAFRAIGIVDDDLYKQGFRIQGLPVIGRRSDIPQLVTKHDVGLIVFAIHNIPQEERREVLEICASTPARVVAMPDILGILNSVMEQTSEAGQPGRVYEPFESITPCQFCLAQTAPLQLGDWLANLEVSVKTRDLEAINAQIEILRQRILASNQLTND
jgi:hypothetical protein